MDRLGIEHISAFGLPPVEFVGLAADLGCSDIGLTLTPIDFNPRLFGWMALAVGAGANLPAIWCDHLLGRTGVATGDARIGVHFRREDSELRRVAGLIRAPACA